MDFYILEKSVTGYKNLIKKLLTDTKYMMYNKFCNKVTK